VRHFPPNSLDSEGGKENVPDGANSVVIKDFPSDSVILGISGRKLPGRSGKWTVKLGDFQQYEI